MQSIGKIVSVETSSPLFLIDESLNWNVAKALALTDYNVTSVREAFQGRLGVDDPEVISWCSQHHAVWVHADDRARKQHREELVAAGIRSRFVYRPSGQMTTKEQLRILSYVLEDLADRFCQHPKRLHYMAAVHGEKPRKRITLRATNL